MNQSNNNKANVYQIDFTAVASGKRIASSKRRVRWRFGLANPEALAAGETGTACRGEEHDVTLVWSVTSGKRLILADGQEVHYSNSRNPIFDFSWTMRGNHVLKIVAHASPPITPTPGWRQYDFFVDGQSFFIFPKVYRLGLAPNDPRAAQVPRNTKLAERGERYTSGPPGAGGSEIAKLEAPSNPHEEEAYLQEAIRQSLEDGTGGSLAGGSASSADLLDFGSAPDPAPGGAFAALPPSTTTADPYGAPPSYGYPVSQHPPQGAPFPALPAPAPAPNSFYPSAPVGAPAQQQPFSTYGAATPGPTYHAPPPVDTGSYGAPPPPQQYVTPQAQQTPSSIGFSSPPADFSGFTPQGGAPSNQYPAPATANQYPAPATANQYPAPATANQYPAPATANQYPAPATANQYPASSSSAPENEAAPASTQSQPTLTMNSLSGDEGLLSGANPSSGSIADQAYAKLVNMDTFSLVNPSQPSAKRNNPFENAAANSVVGGTQSLADLKSRKESFGGNGAKDVMKASGPGALVVSGTQNGSWAGQYGGMQQQPMYGGMQQGGMQQPMQQGGMQQPMYGGGMQQQQPMYGGGMQQQQPSFGMQQQQPPLGPLGGGMGGPPPLQPTIGGYGQQQFGGFGQQQQQPGGF
ncbi:hypothetical protein ACA910_014486 [Epithemia clementina (nom. ined.)]